MRTRSRASIGIPLSFIGGSTQVDDLSKVPLIGNFRTFLHGNTDLRWKPGFEKIEVHTDTTLGASTYNSCDHLQYNGLWICVPARYAFDPPTPALYGYIRGHCVYTPDVPPPQPAAWNALVSDLAKQTTEALSSKFMGAVTLKELRETVTMIRNPFGLFKRGMTRNLPKGITAHRASGIKSLSNYWLEYRYGWRPLKGDVENFSKALAKLIVNAQSVRTSQFWKKFSSFRELPITGLPTTTYSPGGSDSIWPELDKSRNPWKNRMTDGSSGIVRLDLEKAVHKYGLTCEKLNDGDEVGHIFEQVLDVLGIRTWRQIRDFCWETLPLSFVVDWFVDFGNVWRPFDERTLSSAAIRMLGHSCKAEIHYSPSVIILYPQFLEFSDTIWAYGVNRIVTGPVGATKISGPAWCAKTFTRDPGLPPESVSVLTTEGLNVLHGLDFLGLFLQRLPRSKH